MKKKKERENQDPIEQIRRLLILGLIHQGVAGKRIAEVLGIDPATISRLVSAKGTSKK